MTVVRAVGRLDDSAGHPLGTWFAVADSWALTAFHCVGDRHADPPVLRHPEVRLAVGSQVLQAAVTEYDFWLDIALLKLSSPLPSGFAPVSLSSEVVVGGRFEAFGYPQAAEDPEVEGWPVGGSVISVLMRLRDGAPVIAVVVDGLDHELPLQGISGAPVLAGQGPQQAVAVIRYNVLADNETAVALGNTLFATPVAAIAKRFLQLQPFVAVPEDEQRRREKLGSLLRVGLGPDGLLPPLATADSYSLGIPRAAPVEAGAADRYIERAADADIYRAFEKSRFVIVKGEPKSGKSRSAFEAVRALYPDSSLIAPYQGHQALAQIIGENLLSSDPGRLVIWLDELAGFLEPTEGVDRRLVDLLLARYPQAVIVGTIRGKDLDDLRSSVLNRTSREVFERATEVVLPAVPTEAERARAKELYPGEDFTGTVGIAERLIAAPELIKRFDDAANRAGWCLVMGAVDWRRMGATSPVPVPLLRALAACYRDAFYPNLEIDDDGVRDGLEWAKEPIGSSEALLNVVNRTPEYTYRPFDRLRTHCEDSAVTAKVQAQCWQTAVAMAMPTDLIAIALGAIAGEGRRDIAKSALQKTLRSDDTDSAEWAALFLGELETLDGNNEAACELLTRACGAANDVIAELANVDLGTVLMNMGEVKPAREVLEAAAASDNPQIVPLAQASLGSVLMNMGEVKQAREVLEAAIASGSPLAVPMAQAVLGGVLMNTGEVNQAREVLEAAIASGSPLAVPTAQVNLGGLLMVAGEVEQAREMLEAAIASGNQIVVPAAQAKLGTLLMNMGAVEQGRELLEAAIASGNPLAVPMAQAGLGTLLMSTGEMKQAREVLEAAIASGNPLAVPLAQAGLGTLLMSTGEVEQGREVLEAVAASGNPQVVPMAHDLLGDLLVGQEELGRRGGCLPGGHRYRESGLGPDCPDRPGASGQGTRSRRGQGAAGGGGRVGQPAGGPAGPRSARGSAGWPGGLGRRGGCLPGGHRHRRSGLGPDCPDRPGASGQGTRSRRGQGGAGGGGRVGQPAGGPAGLGSARGSAGWPGGLGRRGGCLPGGHRHRRSGLGPDCPDRPSAFA